MSFALRTCAIASAVVNRNSAEGGLTGSAALENGALNYTTNFATGVGQGDVSLGANSFNMIGQHNVGNSALSVEYFNPNTADLVGNGSGGFFGNSAQNMGVTININDTAAGVSAAGVAVGERQAQP